MEIENIFFVQNRSSFCFYRGLSCSSCLRSGSTNLFPNPEEIPRPERQPTKNGAPLAMENKGKESATCQASRTPNTCRAGRIKTSSTRSLWGGRERGCRPLAPGFRNRIGGMSSPISGPLLPRHLLTNSIPDHLDPCPLFVFQKTP